MARVTLTVKELNDRNTFLTAEATANVFKAVDATAGAEFTCTGNDDKYLIVVANAATSAKTVTLVKGNGLQGTADLAFAVAASSTTAVCIDSGRFKNVTGDDKDKVIIKGTDANITVAVYKLA